ncbi:MAG: hypothetical protein ACTHO8_00500 [Solirubrobacterales bacterium]
MATENVTAFEPQPPFESALCEQKLKESEETEPPCGEAHCVDEVQQSHYYHTACIGKAMYSPVQTLGCYNPTRPAGQQWEWKPPKEIVQFCKGLEKQDPNWELKQCFCCCSCFANLTPVGLPEGLRRPIAEIAVGDQVLAGKPSSGKVEWEPARVGFSQGTEDGHQPAMAYLVYGDGEELIASPDQPLMLADGSLTTAGRVVPGQELMGVDGNPVPVQLASLGGYDGGVHHIATNPDWDGSIDNHLIQANGVVAGDFTLQLHFPEVPASEKVADWESLPEIGTAEYQQANSNLMQLGDSQVYTAEQNDVSIESAAFTAYGAEGELPLGAQSLLTPAQAEDILHNGRQAPVTEQSGYALAEEAIALVRGFYPGFTYYIDWNRNDPNLYAFEQYGQKIILLSGGLVRMKGVGFTGLTMAVGHGVGRFLGGPPRATETYSCTGVADLHAFGAVSRKVWFGSYWLKQSMAALDQLTKLFQLISPKHAQGNPLNVCEEPSVACREEIWITGLSGGELPECAGGPPLPALKLQRVSQSGENEVQIVFSQAPVAAEAEKTTSYQLTPATKITKASVDAKKDFIVTLEVEELKAGKYTLTCTGLESIYGGKLWPDPASVEFEITPE